MPIEPALQPDEQPAKALDAAGAFSEALATQLGEVLLGRPDVVRLG